MKGFFITGTDTEIGKTLITALLTLGLRQQGVHCCPIKPIASGGLEHNGGWISEDVLVYQSVSQIDEPLRMMNPFCLEKAASPHLAAELANQAIPIKVIQEHIEKTATGYDCILVEGIGGWRVPIQNNYLVSDFAKELQLPIIVVSANRLGTINHTLLTVESIRQSGLDVHGILFTNLCPERDEEIAQNNVATIERIGNVSILGEIPYLTKEQLSASPQTLWNIIQPTIDWEKQI